MMVDIRKKRIGNFFITNMIIEQAPEVAKLVMSKCIVLGARRMMNHDAVHYTAECDLFDEVNEGTLIPNYYFHAISGALYQHLCFRKEGEASSRLIELIEIKKEVKQMSPDPGYREKKQIKYLPTEKEITRKAIYKALPEDCEEVEDQWEKFDHLFRGNMWSEYIDCSPDSLFMTDYLPNHPKAADWLVEHGFLKMEEHREYKSGDLFIAINWNGKSDCTALLFKNEDDKYFMIDLDYGSIFNRNLKKKPDKDRGEKVNIEFVNSLSASFTFKYLGRTKNGLLERSDS